MSAGLAAFSIGGLECVNRGLSLLIAESSQSEGLTSHDTEI